MFELSVKNYVTNTKALACDKKCVYQCYLMPVCFCLYAIYPSSPPLIQYCSVLNISVI
jgi:hypothetical protein